MRLIAATFLALFLQTTSPAAAGVVVHVGETWIFRLKDGQPVGAHKEAPGAGLAEDELMVRLEKQNGTTMIVTNNTKTPLNYHASMNVGDEDRPTSVCTVASNGRMGIENWNPTWPIAAITLSDFTVAEDGKIRCD